MITNLFTFELADLTHTVISVSVNEHQVISKKPILWVQSYDNQVKALLEILQVYLTWYYCLPSSILSQVILCRPAY